MSWVNIICFMIWKGRRHSRGNNFFGFGFNTCQLIIFIVLTLLFMTLCGNGEKFRGSPPNARGNCPHSPSLHRHSIKLSSSSLPQQRFKGYRCKLDMLRYKWKVNLNFAYSPFKGTSDVNWSDPPFHNSYLQSFISYPIIYILYIY